MKISKRIKTVVSLLSVLVLVFSIFPSSAVAQGAIDIDKDCTLNILYKNDKKLIEGATFSMYKIADVDAYGALTTTAAFKSYLGTADLNKFTKTDWEKQLALLELALARDADKLTAAAQGVTDAKGELSFSGLKPALYIVKPDTTVIGEYTYTGPAFLVMLPAQDSDNNDWAYTVSVNPKNTETYNPTPLTRKVIKVWDDKGFETIRPQEVTVDLLEDGKPVDSVVLNEKNNWRYTWEGLDARHDWKLSERELKNYKATITLNGITFTVVNSYLMKEYDPYIMIYKKISGSPSNKSDFSFILTRSSDKCPMPTGVTGDTQTIQISGAGENKFGPIFFEDVGDYSYTVKEAAGNVTGYTYDSTVYTVTFTVTRDDKGELTCTKKITNEKNEEKENVEFTNLYKPQNNLPQTGLLWWPVPVCLIAGVLMVLIGGAKRKRS